MGHIVRNCPRKEEQLKNKFHAHAVEENEPVEERNNEYEDSIEEYVLISSLTKQISHGSDTWLIDSGASKHMTGYEDSLSCLLQKDSPRKVKLGDDYQYPIKGTREASYKLDFRKSMMMREVLYAPGLKKNLISISSLDKKGFGVAFIDG